MQAHKTDSAPATSVPGASVSDAGSDPRERFAAQAARPSVPQAPSERLAGPFRVKAGYLERRAWPFSAEG